MCLCLKNVDGGGEEDGVVSMNLLETYLSNNYGIKFLKLDFKFWNLY